MYASNPCCMCHLRHAKSARCNWSHASSPCLDLKQNKHVQDAKGVAAKAVEQRGPEGTSADGAAITPIEVDMLLAKLYTQWRGHTTDAFSVYDRVIAEYPQDFRCVLQRSQSAGRLVDDACMHGHIWAGVCRWSCIA